jgi:hypothetical protein
VSRVVHRLSLIVQNGRFAVCRLPAGSPIPGWVTTDGILSITSTSGEVSIVCREEAVPEGVRCESGWRCLGVAGTLDFALVGVLASLLVPLAEAGVSIFALSTFDTDYVLVREGDLDRAISALRATGHEVQMA